MVNKLPQTKYKLTWQQSPQPPTQRATHKTSRPLNTSNRSPKYDADNVRLSPTVNIWCA